MVGFFWMVLVLALWPAVARLRTRRAAKSAVEQPPPWVLTMLGMKHDDGVQMDPNALPPPPPAPTPFEALKAAIQARAAMAGVPVSGSGSALGAPAPGAPNFMHPDVASVLEPLAVPLAAAHQGMLFGPSGADIGTAATAASGVTPGHALPGMVPASPAPPPGQPCHQGVAGGVVPQLGVQPRLGPPEAPRCAAPPAELKNEHVQTALAPNKPEGASDKPVQIRDGGLAWPLADGGWAFQYPNMALRMDTKGNIRAAWAGAAGSPAYAVEYNEYGYNYHIGKTVVSHEANGDLVYHQPSGTVRQEGDLLTYHWCDPNIVVYQTPSGVVYYDNDGLTYKGVSGVAQWLANGDVLYQGLGGVTYQKPDGSVTHWTKEGAIYHRADGSMAYTPVGQSQSEVLSPIDLGPDPFPGPPLSVDTVLAMARAHPTESAPSDGAAEVVARAAKLVGHAQAPAAVAPMSPAAPAQDGVFGAAFNPAPGFAPFAEPLR